MNVIKYLFTAAVVLVITAVSYSTFAVSTASADTGNGAGDLANLGTAQEWSIADQGRYAASIMGLPIGDMVPSPSVGAELSYIANADGTHYVMAASLSSGGVLVGSDTRARGDYIKCEAYTAECISKVTDDPTLIAAAPVWTKF